MHNPLRLQLREDVVNIITLARPSVEAIARKDRDLGNQLRRALSSIGLNIAEGFGTAAGNSRLRFETACGSLNESVTALHIAIAWGTSALTAARRRWPRSIGSARGSIVTHR